MDNFRLCEFSQTNFSSMCSDSVLSEMKGKNKEANHYFLHTLLNILRRVGGILIVDFV